MALDGGTVITGLTSGVEYDVYAYKVLSSSGDDIGDDGTLVTGGKNAIANVSGLNGSNGNTFALVAGAGSANKDTTIIVMIDFVTTAAVDEKTLATNDGIYGAAGGGVGNPDWIASNVVNTSDPPATISSVLGSNIFTLKKVSDTTLATFTTTR